MMRRVVITGVGLVTPLAVGAENSWSQLIKGKSGLRNITRFDVSDLNSKVAGQLPEADEEFGYNVDNYISSKDQRKMDRFIMYGIAAADEAIADSGWNPTSEEDLINTGVILGSGIGGLPCIETNSVSVFEHGAKKLSPFFIPACLINLLSGQISIKYGFQGPNHAVVTACSTGAHAIGDGARMIALGDADVMVAGGAECALCRVGFGGFAAARALSTNFNDNPTAASRPWDKDRDGFVMGEGAGVVILEEYEHAKKRGAKIYGEVVGYGLTGDGYHITAPHPEGRGALRSMEMALKRSGLGLEDIDYVNAHGTSTPLGDEIELSVVRKLFGSNTKNMMMSSTKSSIGHLLGAAGSVEAIFCLLAMRDSIAPPTLNLDNPPADLDIDLVPHKAKERKIRATLSNSFGFGGTNASLIFKKLD
jgi:3-oxoacyl-[acyl-carrier-protein] synthase II